VSLLAALVRRCRLLCHLARFRRLSARNASLGTIVPCDKSSCQWPSLPS